MPASLDRHTGHNPSLVNGLARLKGLPKMIQIEKYATDNGEAITITTVLQFRIIGLRGGYFATLGFRNGTPRQIERILAAEFPTTSYAVNSANTVAVFNPKRKR